MKLTAAEMWHIVEEEGLAVCHDCEEVCHGYGVEVTEVLLAMKKLILKPGLTCAALVSFVLLHPPGTTLQNPPGCLPNGAGSTLLVAPHHPSRWPSPLPFSRSWSAAVMKKEPQVLDGEKPNLFILRHFQNKH